MLSISLNHKMLIILTSIQVFKHLNYKDLGLAAKMCRSWRKVSSNWSS